MKRYIKVIEAIEELKNRKRATPTSSNSCMPGLMTYRMQGNISRRESMRF